MPSEAQSAAPSDRARHRLADHLAYYFGSSAATADPERAWAERIHQAAPEAIEAFLRAARASERQATMDFGLLHGVLNGTPDGMLVVDLAGKVLMANDNFVRMWRIPLDLAASGDDAKLLGFVLAQLAAPDAFLARVRDLYATPDAVTDAEDIAFTDGRVFVRRSCPVYVDGVAAARVWVFHDASAMRQAEREHLLLEEQLRQSQKMEAVGKLAGGIAHDFNNLLTVINGYARLLEDHTPEDDPRHLKIAEIRKAGERAAVLTRQLLAFGRKQVLEPKLLDLGETVSTMQSMLQRVIGEDVTLVWAPPAGLPRVVADPGQVEQVIVNLVVNARDAMPRGGTVTLGLALQQVPADDGSGIEPGEYVVLSVRDTGHGIPRDVQPHIFEPFFTTKEVGKGTGLGLATVYGIVRQSGGALAFESALGRGTTFRVYLPAAEAAAQPAPSPGLPRAA